MVTFKYNNQELSFIDLLILFAERQQSSNFRLPLSIALERFEERLELFCEQSASEQGCYYELDFDIESYTDMQRENLDARQISMLVRYF